MKKVLYITDRVMHYQKETFRALESGLAARGVELHLLSGEDARRQVGRVGIREAVVANEQKYRFAEYRVGTYTFRRLSGVAARIREVRPDVIVNAAHVGNWTHWTIAANKKRWGVKLVSWLCGYEFHPGRMKSLLLGRFIPLYDYHLAYHSNAREYALQHGASAGQVTVVHNTINEARIEVMPKDAARKAVVDRHPEIGARKIILFVGAVLAEKRIEVILEALDIMQRQDAVFVLVGDGEHLPVIRRMCAGRNDVVITGAIVDGVGPYFDAAEMYVLPGTGGLGINEAMAHGLPIVSGYADGSADDLVVDGENGYRLREGTAQEMAECMARLLDDPAQAERMGRVSREWITGRFAFGAFIDRVVNGLAAVATS